jgi:hypothetical protein
VKEHQFILSGEIYMTSLQNVPQAEQTLYEADFAAWADEMSVLLQQKRFAELDLVNLVEEIQDLGNRHRDALESNLIVLLMHLLKWQYQLSSRLPLLHDDERFMKYWIIGLAMGQSPPT